jgi:polyketide cyclase/dehydrase/lipid transport protein
MKWAYIAFIAVVALVAVVTVIGFLLPKDHVATRSATYRRTPPEVYAVIAGPPDWRPDVIRWEELPPENGHQRIREFGSRRSVTQEVLEDDPPRRRVTQIADKNLPFGGKWVYELAPVAEGTRLRITENGEIYNPVFRFVSRFFLGYSGSIEQYLTNLSKKFGETVTIEP